MTRSPIDFAGLNAALLQQVESLLARWLPHGQERNQRWYVGDFDGGQGESANVNMRTGQWIDNANPDDAGGDLISLYARIYGYGQAEAAQKLKEEMGWARPEWASPAGAPRPMAPEPGDSPDVQTPAGEPDAATPAPPPVQAVKREQKWRAVVPVPPHAPPCQFKHAFKDKKRNVWVELIATRFWTYEFDGVLYGHVARYERISSEGELVKETVPHTWCVNLEDDRGHQRWHARQWEAPRPLYVPATLLSADRQLPVVVVEGEKCAEALFRLLGHEFDVVCWPGGCRAWSMAAWDWLAKRVVYLWPDCDAQREVLTKAEREGGMLPQQKPYRPEAKQPGMQAMQGIGTLLQADHGCQVHLVPIPRPGDAPDGWDVADAIEQGWDAAKVRDFIRAARPFKSVNDEARAKVAISTPSGAGAGEEGEAPTWRRPLIATGTGTIKPCRENAVYALDGVPDKGIPGAPECAGVLAFNAFTNDVVKLKPPPWGTGAGRWEEHDELEMGAWLCRELYMPPLPRGPLEEAVSMVARRHAFHPLRQEVEACRGTWDGEKRLGTWLRRVCMSDKTPADDDLDAYLARAGAWFVMAMCARVLPEKRQGGLVLQGPGCKFDYMLVFEGAQGWRKSTIAAALGGEYFADTGLVLGDKDSYQNIQGVWVYEWAELDSLAKADVRMVKQFVASSKDRFRASFDRRPRDYPRQVVFVGTTNESHYLTDPTGNRRFWPVRLDGPADIDWLRANRAQLFAEALVYLDAGHRFHPNAKEQRELFDPQQNERTVDNSLEASIKTYLYDDNQRVRMNESNGTLVNEITMTRLLECVGYTLDKQTSAVTRAAGSVLHRLGWATKRLPKDSQDKRARAYVRPDRYAAGPAPATPNRPAQGDATAGDPNGCPF